MVDALVGLADLRLTAVSGRPHLCGDDWMPTPSELVSATSCWTSNASAGRLSRNCTVPWDFSGQEHTHPRHTSTNFCLQLTVSIH
jgi:hypothetical protein